MRSAHAARPVGWARLTAAGLLVIASPLLGLAALAIRLTTRGPVLFRAQRAGLDGTAFTMYKLRTMRLQPVEGAAPITSGSDNRIFGVGRILRRLKLDEIPQLANVAGGQMAFVGPRPEDPGIVARYYTGFMRETFTVLPGLTSPGSLAYFAEEGQLPDEPAEAERIYAADLLPRKIALDVVFIRNRSSRYSVEIVLRTLASLVGLHSLFAEHQRWERAQADALLASLGPDTASGEAAQ
jgi:lipopolysaccharide/colanic/teichoic acid biosynthesis glycosyltransferase